MELQLSEVTKNYEKVTAVDGISCTLTRGVYGLLGVNGAGKTTLMRMLCTLQKPSSGKITWEGRDIFEMGGVYRKLLGYLPQEFGFYPEFTVYDYLLYIGSIKGLRPAAARQRAQILMKQVGLFQERNKKMRKLSGGMKRRAGIAQALLNDPAVLILDEPTAGLDPNERIRFRNLISELSEKRIVLLSTHIVSDVEYIAGRIFLMKGGRIVLSGTAEELTDSMAGKVWDCLVPGEETGMYLKKYKVSNVKSVHGGSQLRILSEEPPAAGAVPEKPSLEDVFLYYFGEKAGDEDVPV